MTGKSDQWLCKILSRSFVHVWNTVYLSAISQPLLLKSFLPVLDDDDDVHLASQCSAATTNSSNSSNRIVLSKLKSREPLLGLYYIYWFFQSLSLKSSFHAGIIIYFTILIYSHPSLRLKTWHVNLQTYKSTCVLWTSDSMYSMCYLCYKVAIIHSEFEENCWKTRVQFKEFLVERQNSGHFYLFLHFFFHL